MQNGKRVLFGTLLFAILLLSAPFITSNVSASISKPSIPEFSMKYADYSYDIPPTYGVDQYTGKTVITRDGEHVDNRTIEFKIKNQPFTPQGIYKTLYYNFRFKGPYGDSWRYYPDTNRRYGYYTGTFPDTSASNSDYTIISITIGRSAGVPSGVTMEWQVQAIKGYVDYTPTGMLAGGFCSFAGERSDWSDTQTITIGEVTPTATPTESTPAQTASDQLVTQNTVLFGLEWKDIAIVLLVVVVAVLVLAVVLMRTKKR